MPCSRALVALIVVLVALIGSYCINLGTYGVSVVFLGASLPFCTVLHLSAMISFNFCTGRLGFKFDHHYFHY